MRGFNRIIFILVSCILPISMALGQTVIPSRITATVDNASRQVLKGNTHPLARADFDQGPAPADLAMNRMLLVLSRSPEQESALEDLLQKQQDASSSQYHRWLTPDEFGRQFGPSDADVKAVTEWLESQGFQVARISRGRSIVEFSGTAGQVQSAFHTEIHKYLVNGEEHWANASDPQIPAALAPVVTGIVTLHNFQAHAQIKQSPEIFTKQGQSDWVGPQFKSASGHVGLSPGDYAVLYNINPLFQAGINGAGTTIAVVGRTNINLSDVVDFRNAFLLPNNPPQIVLNGPNPGNLGGGEEAEAVLDTSWAGATAPGATVKLVVSASTNTTDGVYLSEEYVIDHNLGDVMTESFGVCEAYFTQAQAAAIAYLAEQAAAQGITYTVASGDSGATGCDDANEKWAFGPTSVNMLASTPYTVAVGGTEFVGLNLNSSSSNFATGGASPISYTEELVWNEDCFFNYCGLWASGGGVSNIFSKPSWQTGVVGIPTDGARDIPDVSLTASVSLAPYLICVDGSCQYPPGGQAVFAAVGGTSASTPAFAGIMALVNQKTGSRQGQANYVLYGLVQTENFANCNASISAPPNDCIFNDVTVGSNWVSGASIRYFAGTGYDLATGLGSINAANLVNQWSQIASAASKIHIYIDEPQDQSSTFSGVVSFRGWALDDSDSIANVTVVIDGIPYGVATYGSARPDVCAVYANRSGCPNVGWNFSFDTTLLGDGPHTLDVTATASAGQSYTVSSSFFVGNFTSPPMRMFIDSPNAQTGSLSGAVNFKGWAIDDFAAISEVAISVDGVLQGTAVYGGSRPDVCAAYPSRAGCPNVGWNFSLDTGLLADGNHTLQVTGTSIDGRNANVTAAFTTSNSTGNPIHISIDVPSSQSNALSGTVTVGGWAIDDQAAISGVSISVDGVPYGSVAYGGNRSDVCSMFPGRAGCPNVGWTGQLDTTLLSDGAHVLEVAATAADGQHATASQSFSVGNLKANSIRISIDTPNSASGPLIGMASIAGWAIDDNGAITQVIFSVDGVSRGSAIYGSSRSDVCSVFPGHAGCPNVGWNAQLDTTVLSNGTHTLEITAFSSTGKHSTASSTFKVGNWLTIPTRIVFDQPSASNQPVTGPTIFSGWAIDNYSAIASAAVAIDGIPYGNAVYGTSRPDVCTVYPNRPGCPNVGWSFPLNTRLLANGVHLLEVTAITDAGWRYTSTTTFRSSN